MVLKVEITAKTTIRPSSTTPHHLKTLKLSLIDQLSPPIPVSVILFYPANRDIENKKPLDLLKRSISKILTIFYPLAGRINDNQYIHCNDEGVNFFETQVNNQLSQVTSVCKSDDLSQLLPTCHELGPKVVLSIQANVFNCGGIALGVQIFHKAADASSLYFFLCSWASLTKERDKETLFTPKFDMTSIFPPIDGSPSLCFVSIDKSPIGNLVRKRFIFTGTSITALKAKGSSSSVALPTRVEAVFALIWRCCMKVDGTMNGARNLANIAFNIRGKLVPPISNHYFGNMLIMGSTSIAAKNVPELHFLVAELRKTIRKVDCDYVKKLQSRNEFLKYFDSYKKANEEEVEAFSCSSWCRFPFYEPDFGWGKPVLVCPLPDVMGKNFVILMDTQCGNGVEAWVTLVEEDMNRFESHPELIAFTSAK